MQSEYETTTDPLAVSSNSSSVQTHLGIMQDVISRMAQNSNGCKTWCITIISAMLVVLSDSGSLEHWWVVLFPSLLFMILDCYYLSLEKGFRDSYNKFVHYVQTNNLRAEDFYSVRPSGNMVLHRRDALFSFATWGFYLGIIGVVLVIKYMLEK